MSPSHPSRLPSKPPAQRWHDSNTEGVDASGSVVDEIAFLAPRSFRELERMVAKRDGWYDQLASLSPHRVIERLLALVKTKQFPPQDLPRAAALVTQQFVHGSSFRPSRFYLDHRIGALESEAERRDASEAADILTEALEELGPVRHWGAGDDGRIPSSAERMEALVECLSQARVEVSLQGFVRYHESLAHDSDPSSTRHPRTARTEQVIEQLTRALMRLGTQAIAYQEVADRYPLGTDEGATPAEVENHGRMILDLTAAMSHIRHRQRDKLSVEAALTEIAGLEMPPIASGTLGKAARAVQKVGASMKWVELNAALVPAPVGDTPLLGAKVRPGEALEAIAGLGADLDEWRQQRAIYSHTSVARIMAPVYVNGLLREREVVHPPEALPGNKYEEFVSLLSAEMLASGDILPAAALTRVAWRGAPVTRLREHWREQRAHYLARSLSRRGQECSPFDDSARTAFAGLQSSAASARERQLYDDVAHAFRRLTGGVPVAPPHVAQAMHCAAIGIAVIDAGVPVEQVLQDLDAGLVPGVRGRVGGTGVPMDLVGQTWDVPHFLPPTVVPIARAAIEGDRLARAYEHALAVHSDAEEPWMPRPDSPDVALDPAAHLAVRPTVAATVTARRERAHRHRTPLRDGWLGSMISEYVARFCDGRVRAPHWQNGATPKFFPLAPIEAHETIRTLGGPALLPHLDRPLTIRWVPEDSARRATESSVGLPAGTSVYEHHGHYDGGPDAQPGESGPFAVRLTVLPTGRGLVNLSGAVPPAARDALRAVGIHPPADHPQPRRRGRQLAVLADRAHAPVGSGAHFDELLRRAARAVAAEPVPPVTSSKRKRERAL